MGNANVQYGNVCEKALIKYVYMGLITIILFFCLISCKDAQTTQAPQTKDRVTAWNEDIDYLNSQLKVKQYNLFSLINETTFNSKIKAIKDSINNLQDYEIIFKMQQLIASLGVAHTTITSKILSGPVHILPLLTYYFSDGLYITSVINEHSDLLGRKILGINGKDISLLYDSLKTIISHENDYWVKTRIPEIIYCVEALKYFKIADNLSSVNLKVEGIGDVTINSLLAGSATVSLKNIIDGVQTPLYMRNSDLYYWYTYLDTNKTLYLKYNSCQNMSSQSFAGFVQEIQNFMNSHLIEKFVIDMRNNGGGSSGIISALSFLQSSSFNQKGKLFVITGRQTFSSALMNAIQFKQNTNCLLIGEPTGGKPNSYGEVLSFTLPNSGVVVQYSTKYFQMMDDDPLSLYPDNDIELSIQDFAQGKDPVMDFILNYK